MPTRGSVDTLPIGLTAPGVYEALEWFCEHIPKAQKPVFLFLVGGPGSGKSAATQRAVASFQYVGEESELAQRSYSYKLGDENVLLINDATIEGSAGDRTPLVTDICRSLASGTHTIANINRGILFEELSMSPEASAGTAVTHWLNGNTETDFGEWSIRSDTTSQAEHVSSATLFENEEIRAQIVTVFMDICSVFEVRPATEFDISQGLRKAAKYVVKRFDQRANMPEIESIAGRLLLEYSTAILNVPTLDAAMDPIAANLASLKSSEFRQGLTTILRGSEIYAGKRFTYRELWGAICLTILGPISPETNLSQRIDDLATISSSEDDSAQNFQLLMGKANHRAWQALCGVTVSGADREEIDGWGPVLRLTKFIDPARDAPATVSSLLYDAFNQHTSDQSPLGHILETLPEDHPVHTIVTKFDRMLDESFIRALRGGETNDSEKRRFQAWYGSYLTRMLAFSKGEPAFMNELTVWSQAWALAPDMPDSIRDPIKTLLLQPQVAGENELFLPVFDARPAPVAPRSSRHKLLRKFSSNWKLKLSTKGDEVTVSLQNEQENQVRVTLDFTIVREALACVDGNTGVTERTQDASPRLERFRATLLRVESETSPSYVISDTSEFHTLYVNEPIA